MVDCIHGWFTPWFLGDFSWFVEIVDSWPLMVGGSDGSDGGDMVWVDFVDFFCYPIFWWHISWSLMVDFFLWMTWHFLRQIFVCYPRIAGDEILDGCVCGFRHWLGCQSTCPGCNRHHQEDTIFFWIGDPCKLLVASNLYLNSFTGVITRNTYW